MIIPKPHRHSIRLPGFDYSQSGLYFVIICTNHRECLFGDIVDGKMILNEFGKIINDIWGTLPTRFPIVLDEFQIMPNHVHMVFRIVGAGLVPARNNPARDDERATTRVAPTITLGGIIGAFKSLTTHEYVIGVNSVPACPPAGRQPNGSTPPKSIP
ncbi:hypothetical protein D4S03_02195 [bacterium]|nr:MAG: hypothetical protein D4S03_02195 [bacterium]